MHALCNQNILKFNFKSIENCTSSYTLKVVYIKWLQDTKKTFTKFANYFVNTC